MAARNETQAPRPPGHRGIRASFPLFLLAAGLWAGASVPAHAEVRILASRGGEVGQYLNLFGAVRQTGERVVIDGPCVSACTLVLSVVPQERICVTRRAALGFHAARWMDRRGKFSPAAKETRLLAATYPAPVQAWIARHGGLSSRLIVLRGRELTAMYPPCR